jgi:glutamate:Na+ symporter, ESS family
MNMPWAFMVQIGIVGIALLLATALRTKVPFFQRFLIPNALTAGFLLFPVYNWIVPLFGWSANGLESIVYHGLNISFIAMTLRKGESKRAKGNPRIFATAIGTLSQYGLQSLVGLLVTFLLIKTLFPDLFPAFGFLPTLGFALGPGQAYSVGSNWENYGFAGGGQLGLTFAAVGYLWSCFGGIFLVNYGLKKGWLSKNYAGITVDSSIKRGVLDKAAPRPVGSSLTTDTEAIDTMTLNIAFIAGTYLLSFFALKGITFLLSFAGNYGVRLAEGLWSINFIFSALTAMLVKAVLKKTKVDHVMDDGSLTRISGLTIDFMVAASIAAISFQLIRQYWASILIMTFVIGALTTYTVPWLCSRLFQDHRFLRMLMIYGASTGTMPTGLILLRVIDPKYETPVASDYMYASGITFVLALPLILVMNFPAESGESGDFTKFWIAVGISAVYCLFVIISQLVLRKGKAFKNPGRVWVDPNEN